MPHVVIAEALAHPQHFAALCEAMRGLAVESRHEDGCDSYAVHTAADGSPRLFVYERWEDAAAFEAHLAAPHTKLVFANFGEWLAEPPRLTAVTDLM